MHDHSGMMPGESGDEGMSSDEGDEVVDGEEDDDADDDDESGDEVSLQARHAHLGVDLRVQAWVR